MLLKNTIQTIAQIPVGAARKKVLLPLVHFIRDQIAAGEVVRLNFICTHNSRRSHLAQVWAQTMAHHFNVKGVYCYSGGTEVTAMFPKIREVLQGHGFGVIQLSAGANPVYSIKYDENEPPVVVFSKVYEDPYNPRSQFAAVLTCQSAEENCPVVVGALKRISIPYEDPKIFDGTPEMDAKYRERSLEIAREMYFVFESVKN